MSIDSLRDQLYREPFKPIVLMLPSGRVVVVKNPELAMLTETGRTLLVSEGDRVIHVDVATVEAMETVAGNGASEGG